MDFAAAIKTGDLDAVEAALAVDPTLVDEPVDGLAPVLVALYHGRGEVADALVAGGAELDLHGTAAMGDVDRLAAAVAVDGVDLVSPDGFTPLELACFFGRRPAARLLLDAGADPSSTSTGSIRTTPLLAAIAGPDPDIADDLLAAGADAAGRGDGDFTPLHAAANRGLVDLVRALLAAGGDPAALGDDGRNPADLAMAAGFPEVAALLTP